MTALITLLLTITLTPTLLDRSDLVNNCDSVASRRSVSKESINSGFAEGVVSIDASGSVGIVDEGSAAYRPCNEFGTRFYRPRWLASATLSVTEGLVVFENGVIVFRQHHAYHADNGSIKIWHQGTSLNYFLNGRLLFTSHHPELASRDLKGYYFGTVESPLIGVPRTITRTLKQLTTRGKLYESTYSR